MHCPECGATVRLPLTAREVHRQFTTPGYVNLDVTLDTRKLQEHLRTVHNIRQEHEEKES